MTKKISIIKLDLEGDKLDVFKGMITTIKQHQPILILTSSNHRFFSNQRNTKNENPAIINLLNNLNYQVDKFTDIDCIAHPKRKT